MTTATVSPVSTVSNDAAAALVPVIARYVKAKEWQRECEKAAREAAKEADLMGQSIESALEANGGEMIAGEYCLRFDEKAGVPRYAEIAKKHIAPLILQQELSAVPPRRVLVIE